MSSNGEGELSQEVTSDLNPDDQGLNHGKSQGEHIPNSRTSICKGPEVETSGDWYLFLFFLK